MLSKEDKDKKKDKAKDAPEPELKKILEGGEEAAEKDDSMDVIRRATQIFKTQKVADISSELAKRTSQSVIEETEKILQGSAQTTQMFNRALFTADAQQAQAHEQLLRETLRLQKTLKNNLEYLQTLGNAAEQSVAKKKKQVKLYQVLSAILIMITIGLGLYYKYGLTPEQQQNIKDRLAQLTKKEKELETKEKVVGQKEEQVVQKEHKVKETEQKVKATEQKVKATEQKVEQDKQKVEQDKQKVKATEQKVEQDKQKVEQDKQKVKATEQKVKATEEKVKQEERYLAWKKQIESQHEDLEKKLDEISNKFVLGKKLNEYKRLFLNVKEDIQLFYYKIQGTHTEVDPKWEYLNQEFFLTIGQPIELRYEERLASIKQVSNRLEEEEQWIKGSRQKVAEARTNDDLKLMEKQIQEFSPKSEQLLQQIDIEAKLLTTAYDEYQQIKAVTEEYHTFRLRNFQTFTRSFNELRELEKLHAEISQNVEKLPTKTEQNSKILTAQQEEIQAIKKDFYQHYNKYTSLFSQNSKTMMDFYKNLYSEENLITEIPDDVKKEANRKTDSLKQKTTEVGNLVKNFEKNFQAVIIALEDDLNKRISQSFLALREIKLPVEEKVASPVKESTTTQEPREYSMAEVKKAVEEMTQFFELSPAEYNMSLSYYGKQENKFQKTYEMKLKVFSKTKGEGRDKAIVFIGKTLSPPQDRGNVILKEPKQFWAYDIKDKNVVRVAPVAETSTEKGKMLGLLTHLGYVNPYQYSVDADKIEASNVGNEKVYRARLFLTDIQDQPFPNILVWLSSKDLTPLKMEFCDKEQIPSKVFYFRSYQMCELGKRIHQIQLVDLLNKNFVIQIEYSNIKKGNIPDYLFEKNFLPTFSSRY